MPAGILERSVQEIIPLVMRPAAQKKVFADYFPDLDQWCSLAGDVFRLERIFKDMFLTYGKMSDGIYFSAKYPRLIREKDRKRLGEGLETFQRNRPSSVSRFLGLWEEEGKLSKNLLMFCSEDIVNSAT